jgi:hypothetical protein
MNLDILGHGKPGLYDKGRPLHEFLYSKNQTAEWPVVVISATQAEVVKATVLVVAQVKAESVEVVAQVRVESVVKAMVESVAQVKAEWVAKLLEHK